MNKTQNVVDVAMATLYRSRKISKIKRAVRNIVDYLGAHSPQERGPILSRIARIMTRDCFSKGTTEQNKFEGSNIRLGDAIALQALETGDMTYLCGNFLGKPFPPNAEYEETLEARQFLASRFYAHVGSSLDLTLQFCRLIFSCLIRHEEVRVKERGKTAESEEAIETMIKLVIVHSMCSPAFDENTQKRWVNNLISAAGLGNEEALEFYDAAVDQCLDASFAISGEQGGFELDDRRQIRIVPQRALDAECPNRNMQISRGVDPDNLKIVISNHLYDAAKSIQERKAESSRRQMIDAAEFLKWFAAHTSQLGGRFDELCNVITSRPRYGVRPMGYDSFLVNISALQCIGITSFSFYPEGEQFPNLKIEVVVRKAGYGLCRLWMYLRDLELTAVDDIFLNWQDFDIALLRSILEYVAVDALHRIVAEKPKKDMADDEVDRPEEPRDVTPTKRVRVRPFIRRLPLGFEASDEARKLAFLQLGWTLLSGMTFVQSHERWAGLPAGKPAPLFKYTDEAVRKSIDPA